MKIPHRMALLGFAVSLMAVGCAGSTGQQRVADVDQGARIWTQTCVRCHNRRAAPEFTAEQWPIIVNHMRTRADLTKSEAEAVASFVRGLRERVNP